uniref:Putative ovule protein n=1 Tax=Solanum chacoense TaxID=4108 RepID=A0A0V0IPL2_SOLCH
MVSEMEIMRNLIQQQLAQLLTLFQEKHATNLARLEAINACFDSLIKDLENSNIDVEAPKNGSQNRGWKSKAMVAGLGSKTCWNSIIPKYTKLDFPRFCGHGMVDIKHHIKIKNFSTAIWIVSYMVCIFKNFGIRYGIWYL